MSESVQPEFGKPSLTPAEMEQMLDQVDLLVSELLDDVISDDRFVKLEQMLESSEAARKRYVQGMQLHSDLVQHFQPEKGADLANGNSPILGMLSQADPTSAGPSPIAPNDAGN